jgi:hypothetical protein
VVTLDKGGNTSYDDRSREQKRGRMMVTENKQHQLRLPVNFEPAFTYVVQKLMKENETLNKNTIMVQALQDMVKKVLLTEFSLLESTQFLNGVVPDGVESVTTYIIPDAIPQVTEVVTPQYPLSTDFDGFHSIFGEKVYGKLVRAFSVISKYNTQKCKNIFTSVQAPYWYETKNGKLWMRGGKVLPPG